MKNFKKLLSICLVIVMLCGVMSIDVFAHSDTDVYTVYFTRGNFTTGGYDFDTDTYIASTYQGTSPTPASSTAFASDLFPVTVTRSSINTTTTRAIYAPNSECTGDINVLDVILTALISKGRTPYGGWDSYNTPNGGYITGFDDDGSTDYYGYEEYVAPNGDLYYKYTGTNWQIAYNTSVNGTLSAASTYGTSITDLFNGMVIVFDLSDYEMYYPAS